MTSVGPRQEVLAPRNLRDGTSLRRGRAGLGRPKGSQNRQTALLKDAVILAAELAGKDVRPDDPEAAGLVSYLRWLAVEEAPTFGTLLGKVLPLQIAGDRDNPITTHSLIEIKIVDP